MQKPGMHNMTGRWEEGWQYSIWDTCCPCPVFECCCPREVAAAMTRDFNVFERMKNNRVITKEAAEADYDASSAEGKQIFARYRAEPALHTEAGYAMEPGILEDSTETLWAFMRDGEVSSCGREAGEAAEKCCAWGCALRRNKLQIRHMIDTYDEARKGAMSAITRAGMARFWRAS
eukprot:3940617-Rhodomonas_salina.3